MPVLIRKRPDRQLLIATARGDTEAFASFYRRYRDLVLAYFLRRVSTPELAADLMMEVFAAALLAVHRAGGARPEDPPAWLFGIARNKLADAYRRGSAEDQARRQLELEPVYLDDDDITRINALSHEHHVGELLDRLPRDQRNAIRARIFDERTYEDIADECDSSPMVIRKRVSRGLDRLRTAVEDNP
jgi:RNA polymerase sigma factor (sigma-70 family)